MELCLSSYLKSLAKLEPKAGGGTSRPNHTGMCARFGWLLARGFWEWDAILKQNFGIWVWFMLGILGTHRFGMLRNFLLYLVQTLVRNRLYSQRLGPEIPSNFWHWVITEILGEHIPKWPYGEVQPHRGRQSLHLSENSPSTSRILPKIWRKALTASISIEPFCCNKKLNHKGIP